MSKNFLTRNFEEYIMIDKFHEISKISKDEKSSEFKRNANISVEEYLTFLITERIQAPIP
jgi:hypothetical protein